MQRRRRAVVADIGGDARRFARQRVEAVEVGALVDEAALGQDVQEIGFAASLIASDPGRRLRVDRPAV